MRAFRSTVRRRITAGMGTEAGAELDAWLREGGHVVTSSDRAARVIQAEFHRRRRAEDLSAWPAPNILDWKSFTRTAWEERNLAGRLLLNPSQELALWSEIIHSEKHLPTALTASVRRLASMAMEAHDLLCSYAPQYLRTSSRDSWDQDAGAFSQWLADFDQQCIRNGEISSSRLPLEMISLLQEDSTARPPLRIAGFDRVLPTQRRLFDAWGPWQQLQPEGPPARGSFHSVRDSQTELESCAYWCHKRLATNPGQRLLIITQDLSQRRGEIERAFLRFSGPGAAPVFEFSLGIPLNRVPLTRSALLLLRWLSDTLDENALDWLFSSGLAASADESAALRTCMRTLRRFDQQRLQWPLEGFLNHGRIATAVPPHWKRRMISAQRSLKESATFLNPIEWADKVPYLLETISWGGPQSQASAEFQALRRWQQALDNAGSLGFDGRRIAWHDFLAELEHAAGEILFAPQSSDAPIQIAGPAESAGLNADALWFLGADEESWPPIAPMHPFLPPHVQRESAMPHSSHQLDREFASAITQRLLASASEVHFSFALQKDDVESRPSRLIAQLAGSPLPIPQGMLRPSHGASIAIPIVDSSTTPFTAAYLRGGAAVLSSQSQCPFKAFATARLAAESWDAAQAGLSAKQRGQTLHAVLHSVWSGKRPGIKKRDDLIPIKDLAAFVRTHVKAGLQSGLQPGISEQMPPTYMQLEETRLVRLVTEWLEFERTRETFTVEQTEAQRTVTIEGLGMNLRLDRVDRLVDGSSLVIDYKTGNVDPKSWDLPRPDDLQLPLYKVFGLETLQPSLFDSFGGPASGGLVFAKVRAGDTCFAGRVVDAKKTINPDLTGNSGLVRRKLTGLDESEWKQYIRQLAEEFIHGRANVDPRDYPKTCERCGLQSVCRIQEPENRSRVEEENTEVDDAVEE
jgi:ATP-dependent helicase/nuclease subunit B